MARPNKQGLDYFPFDVDFFSDEKIEAISGEFGIKGEITAIKLLCAIYRNGYFILWNEMLKMKLLKNLPGVSSELLDNIVNRLVKWDFFDKNLFDSTKVLTSRGIQNRFFSISKRRNKPGECPYLIVNVYNNCTETELLHTESTQRKGKEIKEKEINKEILPNGSTNKVAPNVATRKQSFYDSLIPFSDRYPKEMLRSFFDYWSELNPSGKKMKFEMQKTWETPKRLATWASKEPVKRTNKPNFANHDNDKTYENF